MAESQIPPKLGSLKHGHFIILSDSEVQLGSARHFSRALSRSFSQMVPGTGILLQVGCGCQLRPQLVFSPEQAFCAAT